ncbi:MAG: hypothetical protein RR443_07310 [Anaerorhabdus sp.]|uniref:hypothetical protein n=1 Tax=Anaerorhabdus sp. TaxID=1872524 RepID=UPI002FC949A7
MKKYLNQKIIGILILFTMTMLAIYINNKNPYQDVLVYDIPVNQFTSDVTSINEHNQLNIEGSEQRLNGTQFILEEGNFIISIDYKSYSSNSSFMLWSNKTSADGVFGGQSFFYTALPKENSHIESEFHLNEYVSDLTSYINYGGDGELIINSITIKSVGSYFNDTLIINILITLLTISIFIALLSNRIQKWISDNKATCLVLAIIILVSSIPLVLSSLHNTPYQDLVYHLNRIEGLSDAIKLGDFPYRIHPMELNGYGQAEGIFYPELFLLFPAILRSMNMSLVLAYRIFVFVVNVLTVGIAYISFTNIFKSKFAGNIGTVVYTLAIYRLTALYVRSAVGEFLAIMFLPLVLWGIIEVFYRDKKKWYILVIGMTGLLQSHLITTELVGIICVVFGLINIKKMIRKDVLVSLAKAIVFFVLINSWWLIPFVDLSGSGVGAFARNSGIEEPIVRNLTQLFAWDYPLQAGGQMPFSIGFLLLLGCIGMIVVYYKDKSFRKTWEYKLVQYCLGFGLVSLWMATSFFPWEMLNGIELVNKFASSLQFSWRLLTIASLCFSVITICFIHYLYTHKVLTTTKLVLCTLILFVVFASRIIVGYISDEIPVYAQRNYQADNNEPGYTLGGWYLPENTDTFYIYYRPMILQPNHLDVQMSNYARQGNKISFDFVNQSNSETFIELPIIYYNNYHATINGIDVNLMKSENNLAQLDVTGYNTGSVYFSYKEKDMYLFGNFISLAALICFIILIKKEECYEKIH